MWLCAGSKDPTGPAIKSGDPTRMAAAILQRHHELGQTLRFPLGFMKWDNITQFGAATAGPCVMVIYYAPVLTNEAADHLRWLIRDLRYVCTAQMLTFCFAISSHPSESVSGV